MKDKAAVSMGRRGGKAGTTAQNESRARNAIAAREARAKKRAKSKPHNAASAKP